MRLLTYGKQSQLVSCTSSPRRVLRILKARCALALRELAAFLFGAWMEWVIPYPPDARPCGLCLWGTGARWLARLTGYAVRILDKRTQAYIPVTVPWHTLSYARIGRSVPCVSYDSGHPCSLAAFTLIYQGSGDYRTTRN